MEVFIWQIERYEDLYVSSGVEGYRVLSSSLESLGDRLVLQVELVKKVVPDAGKDAKTPVDHSGRQPLCQCGVCRASREGAPYSTYGGSYGYATPRV